jgi:hypothetical protein
MSTENIFIAHPANNEQLNALKAILKALKIKFEIKKAEEAYNSDFEEKIIKSRKDYIAGKGKSVTLDQLNDLWK